MTGLPAALPEAPTPVSRLALALCPAVFVALLSSVALGPFLPAVAAELGTTVAVVGQVPAAVNALAAALGLAMGPLADRYGARRVLLAGVGVVVLGALGTAAAPTFAFLVGAGLAAALSRAVVAPVAMAIAGASLAGDQRRRAMSFVVASMSGAVVLGVPALAVVGTAFGTWRAAFVGLAALAAGSVVLGARLLPRGGTPPPAAAGRASVFGAYAPLFAHGPSVGLIGASVVRNTFTWMLFTYWGAFLIQVHGLDAPRAALGYTVIGVGHFAASLAFGQWAGRVPLRPLLALLTALAGASFTAALLLPLGPLAAVAAGALGAVAVGGIDSANAALLVAESPAGRATTMTLNQSALSLGTAMGGAAGGVLLSFGGYGALAAALPLLSLVTALAVWLSRPRAALAAVSPG